METLVKTFYSEKHKNFKLRMYGQKNHKNQKKLNISNKGKKIPDFINKFANRQICQVEYKGAKIKILNVITKIYRNRSHLIILHYNNVICELYI